MHDPETHLIPLALFAALGRQPSIKVFGRDYPTPDGTCVRDDVHVSDLADAHVAALDWQAAGSGSSSFNLGNGRGFSVAEVVHTTEQVTGLTIKTEPSSRRFERWKPWAVMHFAAYAYVGESNIDPLKFYDNNTGGTAVHVTTSAHVRRFHANFS